MTGRLRIARPLSRLLAALCVVLGSQCVFAGPNTDNTSGAGPTVDTQAGSAEGTESHTASATDPSETDKTRVSERLRHKDRAAASDSPVPVEAGGSGADDPVAAQYRESDMDFTGAPAKKSGIPQHSPEWTNPKSGDPGVSKSGEKGGTTDINIGVGENKAKPKARRASSDNSGDGDG